jgi:RNA polymerase sigma-70 factor (ECF subfamily)
VNLFKPDIPKLILRAAGGEQQAFAALYNLHVDDLFRFLNQFSGNRDQTAEWVQNSFVNAFTHLHQFGGRSSFKTWLFRIAINEVRTGIRKALPENEIYGEETSGDQPENEPLLHHDLNVWLRHIDERHRAVLLLAEAEGYSHAEIAHMLDITEGTSRSMLARAKNRLRKYIQADLHHGKKSV